MHNQNISDEYLNSFIDDQLDATEKIQTYSVIRRNENLKERVCALRNLKELVQYAYQHTPDNFSPAEKSHSRWPSHFTSLAACLLLFLGAASGWFAHSWSSQKSSHEMSSKLNRNEQADALVDTRKIIVQVSQSNPFKLKAALDETENLLDTYSRTNQQIQIEVIANKQGVDLLRAHVSPFEERIGMMQERYPNLSFLVCGQTLTKLRKEGKSIQLLPHTGVASSAAEQINKRLLQGWSYVRI